MAAGNCHLVGNSQLEEFDNLAADMKIVNLVVDIENQDVGMGDFAGMADFVDKTDFAVDKTDFVVDKADFAVDKTDFVVDKVDFAVDKTDFVGNVDFAVDKTDFVDMMDFVVGKVGFVADKTDFDVGKMGFGAGKMDFAGMTDSAVGKMDFVVDMVGFADKVDFVDWVDLEYVRLHFVNYMENHLMVVDCREELLIHMDFEDYLEFVSLNSDNFLGLDIGVDYFAFFCKVLKRSTFFYPSATQKKLISVQDKKKQK